MNGKAWEILTQEEQIALTLSINHGKSSWQAGEIMEKAHYKYLEIQARAKMFFKIFTLYFQKSGEQLIPDNSDMTWDFQEFILCTLQNRKGYRETIKIIGKESKLCHKKAKERVEALKGYMAWLDNHEDPVHKELHDLIKEFDRWNNFRILPEDLQEPSAFKRRNKTRLLKHLKNLKNLEAFLVDRLINKFTAPRTYNRKVKYLPLISDSFPSGYTVIKIKSTTKNINYISENLKLYIFSDRGEASDYALLVEEYLNKENKDCKQGQAFWPEFRTMIKKADNYNIVNNIIPRRSNLIEAFRDLDKVRIKKKKHKKKSLQQGEEPRTVVESFWNL